MHLFSFACTLCACWLSGIDCAVKSCSLAPKSLMSILEYSIDDKNVRKATYDEITSQCCNCLPGSETLSPATKHFPQ